MRLRSVLFTTVIACSLFAFSSAQALTVVFIHGMTGGNMSQSDANDYWTGSGENSNFVNEVRNNNPYFITYRDGSKYLKHQAIDTANQIYNNVQDSEIIVVAHSMGNLVMRYIMANPSNDGLTSYQRSQMEAVRNKVKRFVGLAGPHKGSVAADYITALLGNVVTKTIVGWIGYDRDAIKDLRPSQWNTWNAGMLHPSTFKKANGVRPHLYLLGSRDCSAGEPWYWREFENIGLCAIDTIVNYDGASPYGGVSKGHYLDMHPRDNYCVDRAWWGYCYKYGHGDGELDNDGMVTLESGTGYGLAGKDGYWHGYSSYDSHHSNRYADSVAKWADNYVY